MRLAPKNPMIGQRLTPIGMVHAIMLAVFCLLYPFLPFASKWLPKLQLRLSSSQFGVGSQTPSSSAPCPFLVLPLRHPGAVAYPSLTSRGSNFGEFTPESG